MKQNYDAYRLLRSSELARRIYCNCEVIRHCLNAEQRKIWPVTRVAGLFGVSKRLLWIWIKAGFLRTQKPPPGSPKKKGIARSEVKGFLKRLQEGAALLGNFNHLSSGAGRPDAAMRKIRDVRIGGSRVHGLTPREFATLAGVSRSSVLRAIHVNRLDAWQPTPCRYRIGWKPRPAKKKRK
jgi:hypothetical protein